ncbi:MAG: hypothetical protein UR25_C0005G0049 [Candidatus Nomurabacteria bacterium GW2011_GWE1_32_28]|uniref:Uncharacterized protein n=1 Tax=Candidatus Nomurabacteria bacterium GW2011_GWF1_31_48 TaxID=1618767 RepID=A0A0F9YU91_9BACT|nr:MAG: hypothetical protein UR10_C0003G0247 [Candidatus Nomurabacteria bacterium GW2011_GWF2_30_133]KKP28466.1 MAG: hypothetical protein UR18_C0004G0048 [Candidatus Nomurabacteria bacterium GW2011_GWE2_31_40]KKP30046.1 MAG: hypothetical protein UR19_C0005G0048 [Candidatus Nomurabacteria bacterium GW2011_GWF1_31_48]KKP34565.1 MAG: hypothetical protein UR25_C0005G0049 [Candidatus Nomurabacteria bacterium GW2011_GWE1_32_28]
MVKHFLKTLSIFIFMIILGLIGVYLVGYFDNNEESANVLNNQAEVAI